MNLHKHRGNMMLSAARQNVCSLGHATLLLPYAKHDPHTPHNVAYAQLDYYLLLFCICERVCMFDLRPLMGSAIVIFPPLCRGLRLFEN